MVDSSLTIAGAFGAGLASFFSPCIVPLIPTYIGYLTGVQADKLQSGEFNRRTAFSRSLGFILGFSTVFILMGATATFAGSFFYVNRELIARVGE